MNDKKDKEECYLYKLSLYEGLNWFKNIVLIGSQQD